MRIPTRIALAACLAAIACLPIFAQKTGSPAISDSPTSSLYQKVCTQLPPNSGPSEVKAAIMALKPSIAAWGCDLGFQQVTISPGGKHFDFMQTFHGIPIYGTQVKANLNHQMRFYSVLASIRPFINRPIAHGRTDTQVQALLPSLLQTPDPDFHLIGNQRCYFLSENNLIPAHKVTYTANTMSWELVLADSDLSELSRIDLASYCRPWSITGTDTTGNAMVFNPDPLTTSGHTYSGTYVDNNDADHPDLNAQRRSVILRDLTWDGTTFTLVGPYVEIVDRESPTIPPVTSTTGDFFFNRSESGFEDVMVYFHVDTFQRYVQHLGFMNLQNGPIKADPHGVNGQDNSHFVPAGTDTRLGFGEGGVDDAEDADVIIHEYGHALSYAGSPGSNFGVERQGLDEGLGDYFAASYSRGLSYNFWKNTFTWDGHNEYWPGRGASVSTLYPPASTDIYTYGEIWATALMEVWPQAGREASDRVVLQSLYSNISNILLSDAAMLIIDADSMLFGGAHHDQYQTAFCQRGLLNGNMQGEPCYVGIEQDQLGVQDWALFPNPATNSVRIQVANSPAPGLGFDIHDLLGRSLVSGPISHGQAQIDLSSLAPGLYLVEIRNSKGASSVKRLRIE